MKRTVKDIEIGGVRYMLDASALICLRYRVRYSRSIIDEIIACEELDMVTLVRIVYEMIAGDKPGFYDFAMAAYRDEGFKQAALEAASELIATDELAAPPKSKNTTRQDVDELDILAAHADVPLVWQLAGELTMPQLWSYLQRYYHHRSDTGKAYVELTDDGLAELYGKPRAAAD